MYEVCGDMLTLYLIIFNRHLISLFGQVAFTTSSEIINRLYIGGYGISKQLSKTVYFNLYTTPVSVTTIYYP